MTTTTLINALVLAISPFLVYFVARPANRERVLEYTIAMIQRDETLIALLVLTIVGLVFIL